MLSLTNSSQQLIQWKGIVEPSFFSLPQSGGILNPGQAMNLPIHFKPAAPGIHRANLSLVSVPLRGNSLDLPQTPPITVSMSGTAITHTEVSTNISSGKSPHFFENCNCYEQKIWRSRHIGVGGNCFSRHKNRSTQHK